MSIVPELVERREAPTQALVLSLPTDATPLKPLVAQKEASIFTLIIPMVGGAQSGLG